MSSTRAVLMSIRPHHAQRIYSGTKPYEFRRVASGIRSGDMIFLYETSPVSAVTGQAIVASITVDSPNHLSTLEPDPLEREYVSAYLGDARKPIALRLCEVVRYGIARDLRGFGVRRAPQSYQFLEL